MSTLNGGPQTIVTNGLILHLDAGNKTSYPGNGTNWYDLSVYKNDVVLYNGPTFNNEVKGSIILDGADDYVRSNQKLKGFYPEDSILTNISFCAWMKTNNINNSGGNFLFGFEDNPTWYFAVTREFGNAPGKIQIYDAVRGWILSNNTLSNNVWYNVVGTFQPNSVSLYLNGSLDKTDNTVGSSSSYSPNPPANLLTIGSRYGAYRMNGQLSNLTMYNRALNSNEVTQNYNALKSRFGL
jgi:hypothetical protein